MIRKRRKDRMILEGGPVTKEKKETTLTIEDKPLLQLS